MWYGDVFCDGDAKKAVKDLDKHDYHIRTKDAVLLSYFTGALTVLFPFLVFFWFITSSDP